MGKILGEIKILGIKEIPDLELQNNYKMETTPETCLLYTSDAADD